MKRQEDACAVVEFKKRGGAYRGSVALSDLPLLRNDPAETIRVVTDIYRRSLNEIKRWKCDVRTLQNSNSPMSARKAWELGDILYRLNAGLLEKGCRMGHVYDHLQRHAGLPPKRTAEFATLRRYVDNLEAIPNNTKWHRIVKTVKSSSQAIANGRQPEG